MEPPIAGCEHYDRNCLIEAPCCKILYPCKLCHDEKYVYKKGCQVERMKFNEVAQVQCRMCKHIMEPIDKCSNCQTLFGKYFCLKCKLYESSDEKSGDIFHCDQCGMCRRGKQQRFFHCKLCGYCRSISQLNKHQCRQNLVESTCPVCLEMLKYSTKFYQALLCGHLIHLECLEGLKSITCPVCGMATFKMKKKEIQYLRQLVDAEQQNLPQDLKDRKVNIICNECLAKTNDVPFSLVAYQCGKCQSFNTKQT